MSKATRSKKLEELAKELAKDLKSEKDLSELSRELLKLTVETALNAELDDHSVIRKSTSKRKIFPHDNSAFKVIYLAIEQASKKWTMPIRDWKLALNRFMIEFEGRLEAYM